jgi:gluconolactonase
MKSKWILITVFALLVSTDALAQYGVPRLPEPMPGRPGDDSSPDDPRLPDLLQTCQVPPPGFGAAAPASPSTPAAQQPQAPPDPNPRSYSVVEIPGVIAAGQRWRFHWQEQGNNGDGIVGLDDGSLLIAQNDNSIVLKLYPNDTTGVAWSGTRTGGSLSINSNGEVFIVQRALRSTITQLAPVRRVLADRINGDPLDCLGGNPNDLTADSKGGAYFTQGGVYYAAPDGTVTKYGENIRPNGIILSADEQTLYVTNRGTIVAFDVQPDGSLSNQRDFGQLEAGGNGDGMTIDSEGRVYVTSNPGVQVLSPEGEYLGLIPSPRGLISLSFGGRDNHTLFVLARGAIGHDGTLVRNAAQAYSIRMEAQGYSGRPK